MRHPPPIVMIHGAFSGGWSFDLLADYFRARGHEVLTPTLRHHDLPPRAKPPAALGTTGMGDYLADLLQIVDALKQPPVLFGHSMGGLLAQMIAARRPVPATVLFAPSPPWGVLPSSHFEMANAQGLYLAGNFWEMPLKPRFWIAASHALDRLPEAERHAVFARFVPESGRAMFEVLHWPLDTARATQVHAREVTGPVLCLVGSEDSINAPGTVKRVALRYRERGYFQEFEGMSHWLIAEPGWEEVAHIAHGWLGRMLGGEEMELAAE